MVRLLLPVLFVSLLGVPRLAGACSCVLSSSCRQYARVPVAFAGDVLDVVEPVTPGPKSVQMRVVRAYKGGPKAGDTITVTMPRGESGNCSLDVAIGTRYVILAEGEEGVYSTSLCHGSYTVKPGAPLPDLPPPAGVVKGTLVRHVVRDTPKGPHFRADPVAGAPLWIVTPHGRITGTTAEDGTFQLTHVPPGEWTVRFDVGAAERAELPIVLTSADDCAEFQVSTEPADR